MVRKMDSSRTNKRCICWEKKVCHESKETADSAVESYGQKVPINSIGAYPCKGGHNCWHIGHSMNRVQLQERWVIMNWWRSA